MSCRRGAASRSARSSPASPPRRPRMAGKLRVTQTKSTISHVARNRATVRALGLRRIGDTVEGRPDKSGELRRHETGEVMKLHELRPAAGSRTARTRVGRGIAAGKGKTAGRGTKGQKARAGSSIPPWFEGGQTPLHQRIPKLRGFRNPFKLEYEVVNLERISALVELGALEAGDLPGRAPKPGSKAAPVTVNQEILKSVGLVRSLDKPLKVLGQGEVTRPLFVVADAFS